ncbi:DUF4181 domain-containing protein [Lysinibacillus sp. 54212]|uniref:DUF4181 domain-containing protein n=1 Tax=Lysinibacillus sp. 54212 TaxID=3119829 RepID=UPI002FC7D519
MLITIIIGAFIAAGVLDLMIRKKFNIERNQKFMDQFINRKHMLFEIAAYFVFLMVISSGVYAGKQQYILLFLFFAVIYVIRTFLEYVFLKEKKRYIITITYVFICLICSAGILLFYK